MKTWVVQLRKGVVELTVLAALRDGETYGYELLQRINRIEGLALTESTVYPLLARLARDRLVQVRAAPSPSGPPRRYYQLTSLGRSRLGEMSQHWQDVRDAVDALLDGGTS
ncbi:MAG: PadR family transcriptional regulator [Candidatus Eiseniibacteriota bacterium]